MVVFTVVLVTGNAWLLGLVGVFGRWLGCEISERPWHCRTSS
jgi:hypothetical protein